MRFLPFGLIDRWRAPAPAPDKVAWLGDWEYAHRGLHGPGVAENSPTAFALAKQAGVGIECDIQRSADNRAVVFHDWALDRLTGEAGPVGARKAADLAQLALLGSADRIPALAQVLEQIGGKVPILIEIKSKRERRVGPACLAVRRELDGYTGPHAVMSFDPRVGRWFATHSPRTMRGLVVSEEGKRGWRGTWERHSSLWHARPHFLAYDVRDLPSAFAAAQRRRGLPVLTWTVRTAEARVVADAHADAPIAENEGFA
ncbi:MAG: glycerophosphodiester phosphodiesterase family protein [Sphingomonadaceae bacterium]